MAIPGLKGYEASTSIKPKDDIDPNKKQNNPAYSLEMCKFIYSQHRNNAAAITADMMQRFAVNRSYSEGRQDTMKYRDWIVGTQKKTGPDMPPTVDATTQSIVRDLIRENIAEDQLNFDEVFSPLPKYVANIIGIMQGIEHDITVESEDENSGVLREEMKYMAWVKNELQPLLVRFNSEMNIPDLDEQPVKPASLEEMELFENIGAFKLPYEIAMEKALSHTEFISNYDRIKDEVIVDLVIQGFSATATYQDPNHGKFVHKHVPIEDVILENSKKPDFSDVTWGGIVEYYTIHELRIQTGLEEEELLSMASNAKGLFGNPNNFETELINGALGSHYDYDDYRIPVIHNFWKSIDEEYYTARKTKNNETRTVYEPYNASGNPKIYDNENRKTSKQSNRRLYHARWIMDSEFVFDYGVMPNSAYNYGKNEVEFPIKMYKVKGKPKMESMIPIEDNIYLTWIKTQNSIAKAPPPGLAIEMDAIENVKWGNKKLKAKDVILIRTLSGNFLYRSAAKGLHGNPNQPKMNVPFTELAGGLGTAVADGIQAIEFFYRQLDVLSGIDGITSSNQQPDRDTGKAVTEYAMAATSNALKPIYTGYVTLKQENARCAGWNIQAFLEAYDDVKKCPYHRALGTANLLAIKTASGFPPVVYGFRIEARSTDVEKNVILEAAKQALAGGKNGTPSLSWSEYSFVVRYVQSGKSIKYIEVYMAKKEQESQAAEIQRAEKATKDQGEEAQKLQAQKDKAVETKMDLETNGKLEIEKLKGKNEMDLERLKHGNEMELVKYQLRLSNINKMQESEN